MGIANILAFHANSALSYGRASGSVVLGAALALLLAATPASRGGPAPPVGPGLARLVRLDRAGFHGAGVQLRRLSSLTYEGDSSAV